MKMFGGQKGSVLSSSDSSEGVLADLGLALTSSTMDANHSILSKASSMHTHANPADIKALKKPDRALPCPRCNSLDTKFCYYNNYNINQPRHFCKGCQRYWTAGGTLRNVAIGAGRRKRKHASLESDSQDSAVEDCNTHNKSPVEVLIGSTDSGSAKGEFVLGRPHLEVLPFERSPHPSVSNSSFLTVNESSFSDGLHQKQIVKSHDKVEPLFDCHNFKERLSTFYEYLRPKGTEAPPDKVSTLCTSHERACIGVSTEQMKTHTLNLQMDLQHNGFSDAGCKLVSTSSSDRQVSNESGCASSLTTQTFSVDACVTDKKYDALDSEVTKEGQELDKGGSSVNILSQSAHLLPSGMPVDGGGSAMSDFALYDATDHGTVAPTKGQLGNAAVKAAWPMISPTVTWYPPAADRALLWEFPWGLTANAVDAAKAALIPSTGLSLKHQPEPHHPSEKRLWVPKTLRIKDADEAARSSIWSTLGITDRQGSVLSKKVEAVFQCHAKVRGVAAAQSQHTSPAAMTQSIAFQETS